MVLSIISLIFVSAIFKVCYSKLSIFKMGKLKLDKAKCNTKKRQKNCNFRPEVLGDEKLREVRK
jgi:hypothetical protein